ncbi:MAG: outer membrane lipoprotein chaperone LolA [Pelistega sp.]|nr:outer membrane lipoprotein chaperone LolA [Pelistega sp.]
MKKQVIISSVLSTALSVVLSSMSLSAHAQGFTVNSDLLAPGAGLQTDLGEVKFTEIPKVVNTTKTDARQQLRDFVKNIKSASGQFAQQTVGGSKAKPAQSGTFAFERPGKFSWKTTKPYEQSVISDGKTVYQYDPDLMQVTERSTKNAVGASPASILFGTGSLDDNFNVKVLPEKDGMVWLRATPKVADAGMSHIDIAFANNLPAELQILDSFGQTTSIKLRNFKSNAAISASTFRFTAPKGVDRVRLD